jgi:hypothetical protein
MAKINRKSGEYIYFHTSGAGNTGYATVVTQKRTYVMTLAAATANALQMFQAENIKRIFLSVKCAAAGAVEISLTGTSQLSTGTPDSSVLARADIEPVTTSGLPQQNYWFEYA